MKYKTMAQTKRQHEYFKLPGNFKIRCSQEVIYPDMESGRMDELYLTDTGILINLEEESGEITPKTLEKFAKYLIFTRYNYRKEVLLGVICHKDPKKEYQCFKDCPSLYCKTHNIYISQDEYWMKYENIINKVKQKLELTDTEALDMAFVCKFIDKKDIEYVIENITSIFEDAKIKDRKLKMDVAVIIEAMIVKHIKSEVKQNELKEMINMREYENEMQKIIYEEFGDELNQKDAIIEKQENMIEKQKQEYEDKDKEYKNKIKELNQMEDLNNPKARHILETLMLL